MTRRKIEYGAMGIADNPASVETYKIIKGGKGTNRRIYDSQLGGYTNLNELLGVVQKGVVLEVVEKNTGRDVTRETLLQIWIECERSKPQFNANQLRELIRIQEKICGTVKEFIQFSVSTLIDIGAID
jgi:polyhydroxyalkanoate synthesis regulator protein